MNKPTIFISSTIYDFADLRSAMKYWLDEMGFITQLSEYNDFVKDTTRNSYDACLEAVSHCDYFVLLIGSRRGGMYPNENISITRKEYRTAYQLAKEGRIKKIVILIRQNVWEVREDRKALHNLLKQLEIFENDKKIDNLCIENYDSNILKDAEHILTFINEVTRNQEARKEEKPIMNWVHTFSGFEDVVKVLKAELGIKANISIRIAEQSIKNSLIYNLQNITIGEGEKVTAYYLGFAGVRKKLKEFREKNEMVDPLGRISLTTKEVDDISNFLLFFRNGINDLDTTILENLLSSGAFLQYSHEKETFVKDQFSRALYEIIREIKRLKQFERDFSVDMQGRMIENISGYHKYPNKEWDFSFYDLAMLNGVYERLVNIQNLTSYLIQYINKHDDALIYPKLLNGLIPPIRPTEDALLKIFEN